VQLYPGRQLDRVAADREDATVSAANDLFGLFTRATQKKNAGARYESARRRSN
jgi:hypothetical protein